MDKVTVLFSLTVDDIQAIAVEKIIRELDEEELAVIKDKMSDALCDSLDLIMNTLLNDLNLRKNSVHFSGTI